MTALVEGEYVNIGMSVFLNDLQRLLVGVEAVHQY